MHKTIASYACKYLQSFTIVRPKYNANDGSFTKMPKSLKIGIGAALTLAGFLALAYALPIISNAAASKVTVYNEAGVPKIPDSAMAYVPVAIGGAGLLIVGIAFVAVGLNEAILPPATEESDKLNKLDKDSTTAEAA